MARTWQSVERTTLSTAPSPPFLSLSGSAVVKTEPSPPFLSQSGGAAVDTGPTPPFLSLLVGGSALCLSDEGSCGRIRPLPLWRRLERPDSLELLHR